MIILHHPFPLPSITPVLILSLFILSVPIASFPSLSLSSSSSPSSSSFPFVLSSSSSSGYDPSSAIDLISSYRSRSQWSSCWKDAVSALHAGCSPSSSSSSSSATGSYFSEEERARLAIAFTNCHLSHSGHPPYPCPPSRSLTDCTAPMLASPIAYHAYTEFTTQVHAMCFYIQSEVFQENTRHAVDALQEEAARASSAFADVRRQTSLLSRDVVVGLQSQQRLHHQVQNTAQRMEDLHTASSHRITALLHSQQRLHDALHDTENISQRIMQQQQDLRSAHDDHHQHTLSGLQSILSQAHQVHSAVGRVIGLAQEMEGAQQRIAADIQQITDMQDQAMDHLTASLSRQEELRQGQEDLFDGQHRLQEDTSQIRRDGEEVRTRLQQSLDQQQKLLASQGRALHQMERLRDVQEEAMEQTGRATSDIMAAAEEMVSRLRGHQDDFAAAYAQISRVLHTVLSWQRYLAGGVNDMHGIMVYTGMMFVVYLGTAARRTRGSRLPALLCLVMGGIGERIWREWNGGNEMIEVGIWYIRRTTMMTTLLTVIYHGIMFRDLTAENHRLLHGLISRMERRYSHDDSPMVAYNRYGCIGDEYNDDGDNDDDDDDYIPVSSYQHNTRESWNYESDHESEDEWEEEEEGSIDMKFSHKMHQYSSRLRNGKAWRWGQTYH
eukprot:gb/GECH01010462.1/.p1 GENE.gb/GECH01010462.1/~~gb/GECH01010462.1/.p1  ORF type:complete len:667 (+),score=195.41 gb/GECH01010462.1/:1-2001(+)